MGAFAIAIGVLLCGSSAFAAQNVGNTSQKGSLLIFPNIDVSPGWDTIVRISNDANTGVDLTCYYINERKGRRDFHLRLTRKQPIWFSVKNHSGTYPVAQFPTDGTFVTPAYSPDPTKGALLCWATDTALATQISHNHLSGNATVVFGSGAEEDGGLQVAYTYPSWNFTARDVAAGAAVGTPGRLDLTGVSGAYDACPSYLVGHFSPDGAEISTGSGAGTEFVSTSVLSVLSCNQDLRQDFILHLTKLKLEVWNEQEVKLTGAYECADSTKWLPLVTADVVGENFTYAVAQSNAAQLKVKGVASTQCPIVAGRATENSALVGTLWTVLFSEATEDIAIVGTTLNGAGAQAGFILWDAQDAVVPELR
jgi:hypothetical protein